MKTALLIQALWWALAGEEPPACPTRDAVAQALAPVLIPSQQPPGPGDLPAGVRVVDLGDTFEVTAGSQTQRYNDPARDCAERARVAAVFIALALNPPMLPPPPPPPPKPEIALPPPPPPPSPPAPAARTLLAAGAAGRLDMAAGGGTHGVAVGGEALFRIERRSVGLMLRAGALTATDGVVGEIRVREQRFPTSLSATMRWHDHLRLQLMGELGLSLTPLTLSGEGFSGGTAVTRLDAGPRAGLELRLATRAVVVTAGGHVEYFPGTHTISVTELGQIGSSAPLQVGFSLGLELPAHHAE